ncbi:MAG: acetylornithine transaminase [Candidatus Syntropharchaeia archaeon]
MQSSLIEKEKKFLFQVYKRQPVVIVEGRGAVVKDVDGNEYIDCVAGIAVNNVGHCHPEVVEGICRQARRLMHVSNLYYTEPQIELAEKIAEISGMEKIFFCNSGTEAVEAALKLARRASGKKNFIAAEGSFHGRTLGSLSVTSKKEYKDPFKPLISGISFVPFNDADAIRKKMDGNTAAVILEPIQVESGGIRLPKSEYLKEVREICEEKEAFLILDEVQTGFGRTGRWFAKDHYDVDPDIICIAKGMGGGFPIGAMAAKGISFERGEHASTFGGNPLACTAALSSISVIEKENLLERSEKMGEYFMKKLNSLNFDFLREVRGKGLLIGVEVSVQCDRIVDGMRKRGILINCISENVLRFVPPLVIERRQIDEVVENLKIVFEEVNQT